MKSPIKPNAYPKFFSELRRAAVALGYTSQDERDAYYRRVVSEVAHCSSVKQLPSLKAYDACLARFAADAGDFQSAVEREVERLKRTAYVIKVMCCQIMQLKDLDESAARNYFEGLLRQSRLFEAFHADGPTFYLDFPQIILLRSLQMLDTHLRRLKRQFFPTFPLSFNDRIRYVRVDGFLMREPCDEYYYANLPFDVRFST